GCAFHFEGACDLLIEDEVVDDACEPVLVAFGVGCFELVAAVSFGFELEDFGTHPLFDDVGFDVCAEKQVDGQFEVACDENFLFAVFGVDFCFAFHGVYFLGLYFFMMFSSLLNRSSHSRRNGSMKSAISLILSGFSW